MPLSALLDGQLVVAPLLSDHAWAALTSRSRPGRARTIPLTPATSHDKATAASGGQGTRQLTLPCGQRAFARTSPLGTRHFVHQRRGTGCEHAPETAEHLLTKSVIVAAVHAAGWHPIPEARSKDGTWIADVLAVKPHTPLRELDRVRDGRASPSSPAAPPSDPVDAAGLPGVADQTPSQTRVAFEVQWSRQSLGEYQARQERYARHDVRAAWFTRHHVPGLYPRKDLPIFGLDIIDAVPYTALIGPASAGPDSGDVGVDGQKVQAAGPWGRSDLVGLEVRRRTDAMFRPRPVASVDPFGLPVQTMVRALLGGAVQFRTHLGQLTQAVETAANGSAVPRRAVQLTISVHPGHCYGCRRSLWLWSLRDVDTTQHGACGLTTPAPYLPPGLLPGHPVGTAFVRESVIQFSEQHRAAREPAIFGMRKKEWSRGPSRGVGFSCPRCSHEVSRRDSERALASSAAEVFTTAIPVENALNPSTPHWCLDRGRGHCP